MDEIINGFGNLLRQDSRNMSNLSKDDVNDLLKQFSTHHPLGRFMHNVIKNTYDKQYTDASDMVDSIDVRMDIRELSGHIMIYIDLPGVKKDTIGLFISDDDVFELKAERNLYDTMTDKFHIKERESGKIHRTILLPKNLDKDSITASYEDGVLVVKILKLLEKKTTKQIFIN